MFFFWEQNRLFLLSLRKYQATLCIQNTRKSIWNANTLWRQTDSSDSINPNILSKQENFHSPNHTWHCAISGGCANRTEPQRTVYNLIKIKENRRCGACQISTSFFINSTAITKSRTDLVFLEANYKWHRGQAQLKEEHLGCFRND